MKLIMFARNHHLFRDLYGAWQRVEQPMLNFLHSHGRKHTGRLEVVRTQKQAASSHFPSVDSAATGHEVWPSQCPLMTPRHYYLKYCYSAWTQTTYTGHPLRKRTV